MKMVIITGMHLNFPFEGDLWIQKDPHSLMVAGGRERGPSGEGPLGMILVLKINKS